MTRRLTIIASVAATVVFVSTQMRSPETTAQWPPLVPAGIGAGATFFYIWFLFPLIAWLGSVLLARLRRVVLRSVREADERPAVAPRGSAR